MAKRITRQETIQDNVFENAIDSARQFLAVMKDLRAELKQSVRDSQQALQGASFSSSADLKKLQAERQKLIAQQIQAKKIDQEEIRTKRELEKLERERIRTSQLVEREQQRRIKAAEREKKQQTDLNNAYTRASRKLTELRKQYKNLAIQNKENTKEGKKLLRQITTIDGKLKAIDATVGQNQRNVGNYTSAFKGLKGGVLAAAGAFGLATGAIQAVTQALSASFRLFSDFGLVTSKVQAVSGATAEEFKALKDQAKELGTVTPFTASNVAQLQLELSKLGFTANQIQDSTGAILNFAIATDSDLGRSAEVVASTLNAFQLEASEAGRVADVAAKAFSNSALDIEKFAVAMSAVGPASNAVDVSVERTTAILGKIVDAGIDASTAGTALRNVFIDLADQGLTWEEAMNKINSAQNSLSAANELFGKRGAVVAQVIADNNEGIGELEEKLNNAAGAAEDAANIIGDNLAGDVKKFQSALEGSVLEGEGLNKFFRFLVQLGTKLIDVFKDVSNPFTELFSSIGKLAGSLGLFKEKGDAAAATANVIGKVLKVVQLPITIMVKGVTAIINLFTKLVQKGKELGFFREVANIFKSFGEFVDSVKQKVSNFIDEFPLLRKVVDEVSEAIEKVGDFLSDLGKEISDFLGLSDSATESLDDFEQGTFSLAQQIEAARQTTGAFSKITGGLANAIDSANTKGKAWASSLSGFIRQSSNAAASIGSIDDALDKVNETIGESNIKEIESQISVLEELFDLQRNSAVEDKKAIRDRINELQRFLAIQKLENQQAGEQLGILPKLREELKKVREEKDASVTPESIALSNQEIENLEAQIKHYEDLGKSVESTKDKLEAFRKENERIDAEFSKKVIEAQIDQIRKLEDLADDKDLNDQERKDAQLKAEEDFNNKVLELEKTALQEKIENAENNGQNSLDLQKRLNDIEIEEQRKKNEALLKGDQEAAKKRADAIRENADLAQAFSAKVTEKQLENIDKRLEASRKEISTLEALAQQGNASAVEALARERKREAERLRDRERVAQRQRRVEAIIAGIKVYAAKVEAGEANPVGSTIKDTQLLIAGLSQLYEGTEFVDSSSATKILPGGKDAYASRLHYGERVVDDKNNSKIGNLSNNTLADIADSYNKGLLVPFSMMSDNIMPQISHIKTEPGQSREMVNKLNTLIREVKNGNAKTPEFNAIEQMIETKIRQGNKYIIDKYKLKKFLG